MSQQSKNKAQLDADIMEARLLLDRIRVAIKIEFANELDSDSSSNRWFRLIDAEQYIDKTISFIRKISKLI